MRADDMRSVTRLAPMLASQLPRLFVMLKLLGSIAIGRLLGFGIVGILVIYALLTLLR